MGFFIGGSVYLMMVSRLDSNSSVVVDATVFKKVLIPVISILLGAVAGAISGVLVGIGTPERLGKRYGQYLHSGGILLSVECDTIEEASRAENILKTTGGHDVHRGNEKVTWEAAIMKNIEITNLQSKNILQANN